MKTKTLIYVAVGGVVLYFLYNYFSGKKNQVKEKEVDSIPEVDIKKNNVAYPPDYGNKVIKKELPPLPIKPTPKPYSYGEVGNYITTGQATVLRKNPNKKDFFDDFGADVVRTIPQGQIVDIVKVGGGGRGVVMTKYYFLANGDYITNYLKKV
jgi:hypothetical protein